MSLTYVGINVCKRPFGVYAPTILHYTQSSHHEKTTQHLSLEAVRVTMRMRPSSSIPSLLCWLLIVAVDWTVAVDQRKFRTCSQTSFCRRHRERHSAALYQYKLEASTVKFHIPSDYIQQEDDGKVVPVETQAAGGSLWGSLQQRVLGANKYDGPKKELFLLHV